MRRFLLAVVIGLLSLSASDAWSLIVTEPCTGAELPGRDDQGTCPPTCVTCGCCAQAVETVALSQVDSPDSPNAHLADVLPQLLKTDPLDILHVPKIGFA